jgi:pimeloyl-[acyl-carrier protein] synthase
MNDIRFNPFETGFTSNPYDQYRELRKSDPIHRSFMGTWIVTRYADVSTALKNPAFSSDLSKWPGFNQRYRHRESVSWLLTRSVLNQEGAAHSLLRRAIVEVFSASDQDRFQAVVGDILREHLDHLRTKSSFDAIEDFALPVPVHTICRIFDVAAEHIAKVKAWSTGVSSLIEPLPTGPKLIDAEASVEAFKNYLLDRMQHAASEGLPRRIGQSTVQHGIGIEDALANLVLMFPAGHETTVNLIGNGLLLLLRHPEQRDRLLEDPSLWPGAIEEILRFESPQQVAWRVALSDVELGGTFIAAGEQLMMVLGAANRDPEIFGNPDQFDISRTPNRHLALGVGRHACLGGWFARMQGQLALKALVEAFPTLELAGTPAWYPTVSFHGMSCLPVRIRMN